MTFHLQILTKNLFFLLPPLPNSTEIDVFCISKFKVKCHNENYLNASTELIIIDFVKILEYIQD